MNEKEQAWEAGGQLLGEQGISESEPKLKLLDPERQTFMVTWVRTSEMSAEVIPEPGVTRDDVIEAIEAGLFCWGEITDPDTGERIATVRSVDEGDVEDNDVYVEQA